MTERGVGKWLRRHGFTPQRPARRSYRQDQQKVTVWLQEDYPAIAARARAEKAMVAWAGPVRIAVGHCPAGTLLGPGRPDPPREGQRPTVPRERHVRHRLTRRPVVHRLHPEFRS